MKNVRNIAIIALVALLFVAIPGGGTTLDILVTTLSIVFFALMALLGVRMYRENRFSLDALPDQQRLVLYGSIALALLALTATNRLFATGGVGVLLWLSLLALASFGVFWVYSKAREY